MMDKSHADAYKKAGVDITAGYEAVKQIKPLVESTFSDNVLSSIGGFGGLFMPDLSHMSAPVFVSGTDGVGTKLKLAFILDQHDSIGIDCVAMCVNDIICSGAKPLFFLDYIACGENKPSRIAEIVSGVVAGCKEAGCALLGGETAEMPGFYDSDEYDLAGFAVGVVDREKILEPTDIKEGDVLIGLASSGLHSNGFSLVRKLLDVENTDLIEKREDLDNKSLGEVLLEPTRIYVSEINTLYEHDLEPKAMSHITGGGFYENVPRMLPETLGAVIEKKSFPHPPIFKLIQTVGKLSDEEMYNTFNMGIGMVLAVDASKADETIELLNKQGDIAYKIGKVSGESDGVTLI